MTQTGIDLEKLRNLADDLWHLGHEDNANLIWIAAKEIEHLRLQVEAKSNAYWSK